MRMPRACACVFGMHKNVCVQDEATAAALLLLRNARVLGGRGAGDCLDGVTLDEAWLSEPQVPLSV